MSNVPIGEHSLRHVGRHLDLELAAVPVADDDTPASNDELAKVLDATSSRDRPILTIS